MKVWFGFFFFSDGGIRDLVREGVDFLVLVGGLVREDDLAVRVLLGHTLPGPPDPRPHRHFVRGLAQGGDVVRGQIDPTRGLDNLCVGL